MSSYIYKPKWFSYPDKVFPCSDFHIEAMAIICKELEEVNNSKLLSVLYGLKEHNIKILVPQFLLTESITHREGGELAWDHSLQQSENSISEYLNEQRVGYSNSGSDFTSLRVIPDKFVDIKSMDKEEAKGLLGYYLSFLNNYSGNLPLHSVFHALLTHCGLLSHPLRKECALKMIVMISNIDQWAQVSALNSYLESIMNIGKYKKSARQSVRSVMIVSWYIDDQFSLKEIPSYRLSYFDIESHQLFESSLDSCSKGELIPSDYKDSVRVRGLDQQHYDLWKFDAVYGDWEIVDNLALNFKKDIELNISKLSKACIYGLSPKGETAPTLFFGAPMKTVVTQEGDKVLSEKADSSNSYLWHQRETIKWIEQASSAADL